LKVAFVAKTNHGIMFLLVMEYGVGLSLLRASKLVIVTFSLISPGTFHQNERADTTRPSSSSDSANGVTSRRKSEQHHSNHTKRQSSYVMVTAIGLVSPLARLKLGIGEIKRFKL